MILTSGRQGRGSSWVLGLRLSSLCCLSSYSEVCPKEKNKSANSWTQSHRVMVIQHSNSRRLWKMRKILTAATAVCGWLSAPRPEPRFLCPPAGYCKGCRQGRNGMDTFWTRYSSWTSVCGQIIIWILMVLLCALVHFFSPVCYDQNHHNYPSLLSRTHCAAQWREHWAATKQEAANYVWRC